MTKVGIVVPTRGNRPLNNTYRWVKSQTRKPDIVVIADYKPTITPDLTQRVRRGLHNAFSKGADIAFIFEDDDYYAPNYIQHMLDHWNGEALLGIEQSLMYHQANKRWRLTSHPGRASLYSTGLTREVMGVDWPPDRHTFLDLHLWQQNLSKAFAPIGSPAVAVGVKHGIGLVGSGSHNPKNFGHTQPPIKADLPKSLQ